jgi:hypothetical protein
MAEPLLTIFNTRQSMTVLAYNPMARWEEETAKEGPWNAVMYMPENVVEPPLSADMAVGSRC